MIVKRPEVMLCCEVNCYKCHSRLLHPSHFNCYGSGSYTRLKPFYWKRQGGGENQTRSYCTRRHMLTFENMCEGYEVIESFPSSSESLFPPLSFLQSVFLQWLKVQPVLSVSLHFSNIFLVVGGQNVVGVLINLQGSCFTLCCFSCRKNDEELIPLPSVGSSFLNTGRWDAVAETEDFIF